MAFQLNHTHGGKKKGMAEYRASLTREAYEEDPSKCLNVVRNIISDAEKGDPVCRKIFSQSYMTKAPTEVHVTNESDNLCELLEQNGFSREETAIFRDRVKNRTSEFIKEIVQEIVKNRESGSNSVVFSNE